MIPDAFVNVLGSFVSWLVSSLPAPAVPDWLSGLSAAMASVAAVGSSLAAWFPVGLLPAIIASWAAAYAVGVLIKLARIVASFLTAGGGSAA